MAVRMVAEDEKAYTMHDGRSPFRVPKAGLSEDMHAKIRGMAQKMADGGVADAGVDAGVLQDELQLTPDASQMTPEQYRAQVDRFNKGQGEYPVSAAAADQMARNESRSVADARSELAARPPPAFKTEEQLRKELPDKQKQTKPPAAAPPVGGGYAEDAGRESMAEIGDVARQQLAGEEATIAANQAKAEQKAQVMGEAYKAQQQLALREQEIRAKAAAETQADLARIKQTHDEIAKIDATVDPGRFWATRSTGGKIAGIIGLVLGSIGAANDGVNRAAGLMSQAIDRDLDAQKAEHELRLRKGQQAAEGAQSLFALHRQVTGDDLAGMAAAKASAWQMAAQKAADIEASNIGPAAKAQLEVARARFMAEAHKAAEDARKRLDEKNHNRATEAISRGELALKQAASGGAGGPKPGADEALADVMKYMTPGALGVSGKIGELADKLPFINTEAGDFEAARDGLITRIAAVTKQKRASIEPMMPHAGMKADDAKVKLRQLAILLKSNLPADTTPEIPGQQ